MLFSDFTKALAYATEQSAENTQQVWKLAGIPEPSKGYMVTGERQGSKMEGLGHNLVAILKPRAEKSVVENSGLNLQTFGRAKRLTIDNLWIPLMDGTPKSGHWKTEANSAYGFFGRMQFYEKEALASLKAWKKDVKFDEPKSVKKPERIKVNGSFFPGDRVMVDFNKFRGGTATVVEVKQNPGDRFSTVIVAFDLGGHFAFDIAHVRHLVEEPRSEQSDTFSLGDRVEYTGKFARLHGIRGTVSTVTPSKHHAKIEWDKDSYEGELLQSYIPRRAVNTLERRPLGKPYYSFEPAEPLALIPGNRVAYNGSDKLRAGKIGTVVEVTESTGQHQVIWDHPSPKVWETSRELREDLSYRKGCSAPIVVDSRVVYTHPRGPDKQFVGMKGTVTWVGSIGEGVRVKFDGHALELHVGMSHLTALAPWED